MRFGKLQKGNPHRLTIRQHTFPRASIARFADGSGRVNVHRIKTNKSFLAAPESELFCAKRVWDQRAEDGSSRKIERPFQVLAQAIVDGTVSILGEHDKSIINAFFALCFVRAEWKSSHSPKTRIPGAIGLKYETSRDLQEALEGRHVICFGPDFTIPSPSIAGIVMQSRMHQVEHELEDAMWGIMRAAKGEFVVADNFWYGRTLPISPLICLVSAVDSGTLTEEHVAWLNREAISNSQEYYFAKNLSGCPI
ncbi:MAG: hypothetical protein H7Z16_00135 [Pyrinomonadaceae bacterium]|nr:hypothetical protein [Pyrinomonadaceae bacterium]